jgi:hypothetical protein
LVSYRDYVRQGSRSILTCFTWNLRLKNEPRCFT